MAKKSKKKYSKFIVIGSIVLIIVLMVVAKKSGLLGKEPLELIVVEKPAERTIVEIISASGRVQPVTEIRISPDVSGEIVELNVKEGDDVNRGDVLLKIKPDTYVSMKERAEATLNSSRSQLEQTKAQLRQASQTYERQKQLFEAKAISESDYEAAETQYNTLLAQVKTAEFNIQSAEAALKETQENLDKTTIFAPSSGTISKLDVELGERVVGTATMTGTEMLRIADLNQMEIRADVNENDIVRVELGDTATIEIDAYTGRTFKGVVSRIASSSKNTGTSNSSDQVTNFEVRVYIIPESYKDLVSATSPFPFRPGMSSSIDIATQTQRSLSIPIQAVTTRTLANGEKGEVIFVYQADSSLVKQLPIKTGIQDKKYIVISQGVDSSMQVVTGPFTAISKKLSDSQKVTTTPNK